MIRNEGTIEMIETGASGTTQIRLTGDAALTGNGVIDINDGANNYIEGTGTLTNVDNTIQGAGQLGRNQIGIINQAGGLVNATSLTQNLVIDPNNAAGMTNLGTLKASAGGTLVLSGGGGGGFANAGGTIKAENNSKVMLADGASVTGGTLATSGDGIIVTQDGNYAYLTDVTNTGTYVTSDNGYTGLSGTINNSGTIKLLENDPSGGGSTSGTPHLWLDDNVTLNGGGVVQMNDSTSNEFSAGADNGHTLTNVDNTIEGAGKIGENLIGINNQGIINANLTNTLTIDPNTTQAMTNTGMLKASAGGTLVLSGSGGGAFANAGGTIKAEASSKVMLADGASVTGGTLATSDDGIIVTQDGNYAYLTDITNSGTYITSDNSYTGLSGTITNAGTIKVLENDPAGGGSTSGTPHLWLYDNVTLNGGGVIQMNDSTSNEFSAGADNGHTLTNVDNTIEGAGKIGENHIGIINQGLIQANLSNTLTINPSTALGLVNDTSGILRASDGATLVLAGSGSTFDNQGTIEALNNSAVTYDSSATTLNNQTGNLINGTWRAVTDNSGTTAATVSIRGDAVHTNNATIELSGAGSVFQTRNGSLNTFTALEDSLTTNGSTGTLKILDSRNYTTANDFTNRGNVELGGGTLDANTLTNEATGQIYGHGTIADTITNHGLVKAQGGTLTATIDGQSGTIEIDPGASLTLSGTSDADDLVHNGDSLNLGGYNVTIDTDYTNGNWGSGNTFNHRTNVTDTGGQILASGTTTQTITGEVADGTTATAAMDFGNVHVGDSNTKNYQVANTGTDGPVLRGAVQTSANGGNIDDSRLSGSG